MRKRELSQAAMAVVLVGLLQDRKSAIGISKVAAKEAQDVIDAHTLVAPALGAAVRVTTAVTKRRDEQKRAFLAVLTAVLGPARALATATGDTDLLALVTLNKRTLGRLRPQALVGVGKKLVETMEGLAAPLADYAVDAATIGALRAAYEAYVAGVPQTRQIINARSVATMTAQEQLKALLQQIYELDAAIEIFAFRDPALYADYKKARQIIDVGARPDDAADAGGGQG